MTLRVYKFIIPPGKPVIWSDGSGRRFEVDGVAAMALAESEPEALLVLQRYAKEEGLDADWLTRARVIEMELDRTRALIWVQN